MTTPAESVAQELAAFGTRDSFATRFTVDIDPQLWIDGVGQVPLPVAVQVAHKLCAVAQPAHHGYKDQTRLDPSVRDTWELPASRIQFESPLWDAALQRSVERIRRDLGLPSGSRLRADLHNLLIYGPGQFFATHQDSEKIDGMVGTLVITLPSVFKGGEFVVSHQGQTLRNRGSASQLGMLAFYADCYHEVRPVKQGHRVVLTYNLIAEIAEAPVQDVTALAAAVQKFWRTAPPPAWEGAAESEPPDRLVYLLDHEYTRGGLSWAYLKGADGIRVAALRRVAEQLDAEMFLALAEVHETWSAEAEYEQRGRWDYDDEYEYGDGDDDDDDDDMPGDADDVPVADLIDSEIELRHWVGLDGNELPSVTNWVASEELCVTRESADCTPFESEYEGYMGNYGNTVDRWYHRAAVVMWPRERAFSIRARQAPGWAVEQVAEQLRQGDPAQALKLAGEMLPTWPRAAAGADDAVLFECTLAVATVLGDAETVARMLAPFSLRQVTPDTVPLLVQLLDRRGAAWCGERLQEWTASYQPFADELAWLEWVLPALTRALRAATIADGPVFAGMLVENRWDWLQAHVKRVRQSYRSERGRGQALENIAPAVWALIRSAENAGRPDLQGHMVGYLLSPDLPLQARMGVLRAANTESLVANCLAPVYEHCLQAFTANLAQPERAADDWSIQPPEDWVGEPGATLARFLKSSTQRQLEWPLAQAGRQIIHQLIDDNGLPVQHETRRTGRPYTLVLDKTDALFQLAAAERQVWENELSWLRQIADTYAKP